MKELSPLRLPVNFSKLATYIVMYLLSFVAGRLLVQLAGQCADLGQFDCLLTVLVVALQSKPIDDVHNVRFDSLAPEVPTVVKFSRPDQQIKSAAALSSGGATVERR